MPDPIKQEKILFPNGNSALAVFPTKQHTPDEIIKALGLQPKPVILILGGADTLRDELKPRLNQWFGRGIARAAIEADTVIVDGGTQAGVMSLMGEGVASNKNKTALIGVAPASLIRYPGGGNPNGVDLEPNHSHFVLVEGDEWGSKSKMMFELVNRLSKSLVNAGCNAFPVQLPQLAVLAGGKATTRKEVLMAVQYKMPIIVLEGSENVADEIVAAAENRSVAEEDMIMAEIIEEGDIRFHSLKRKVQEIHRLIIARLGIDKVLDQAWGIYADYDHNANLHQKSFRKIQFAILLTGVIGTLLAVSSSYSPDDGKKPTLEWQVLHYVLIGIPILLTVLITAATRFKRGNKWLLLRAGAESIKQEIYRYRARAKVYREDLAFYLYRPNEAANPDPEKKQPPGLSPAQQLAKKVEEISRRTMRTEVNTSALVRYDRSKGIPPPSKKKKDKHNDNTKFKDDGYSILTPDCYVAIRLEQQLNFYVTNAQRLDKKLNWLYWLTFIIGGLSTLLAAIGFGIWIAMTTAVVSAFGTYMGYLQIEATLIKYNQAAADLQSVQRWWNALSSDEQADPDNIDTLVDHTEQVLQSELDGWIQQMQNALEDLRKNQEQTSQGKTKDDDDHNGDAGDGNNAANRGAGDAAAGRGGNAGNAAAGAVVPNDNEVGEDNGEDPDPDEGNGGEEGDAEIRL